MAKDFQLQQNLRPGQIIQGKILKIFPDNKAMIQLGSKKMVAQLEASLSIEGKYHFQVLASDDMIHLKVLGEQLKEGTSITELMSRLGLKITKSNQAFVQKLINENVSFNRTQLEDAFQIMDRVQTNRKTQDVLLEMFVKNLPIRENIFHALNAKNIGSFSNQTAELLQILKSNTGYTEPFIRLEQMIKAPVHEDLSFVKQMIADVNLNKQQLFQVFKSLGLVNQSVDFSVWKAEWNQLEQTITQNSILDSHVKLPFDWKTETIIKALELISLNKQVLLRQANDLFSLWENKLKNTSLANAVLPQVEFLSLKEQLNQKILPHLPVNQSNFINQLANEPEHLNNVYRLLETFSRSEIYHQLDKIVSTINLDRQFMSSAPKEQFLQQLHQVLQFMGIDYEHQLATDSLIRQQSLKAILLQLIQQNDGSPVQEKAGQLVHFINGMQLNSIHESANLLQAIIQIPAEKLGMNKDIELEFESKKTVDGKIDPDYCRILFYLDLKQLKETVIDMHIQKRSVSITIYNDIPHLKNDTAALKPVLKQGLESINYQLSTIQFKPLQQRGKVSNQESLNLNQSSYQGVDYRI